MEVRRWSVFILLAVVLFAVGGVLYLADDQPDPKVLGALLYFGLTSFSLGHLLP